MFKQDLTRGDVTKTMLLFSLPLILGNLLQQFYNIADTIIVGKFLGASALAAVGASYTLMIFLNSILLGMCMGCGVLFSICFGRKDTDALQRGIYVSFLFVGVFSIALNVVFLAWLDKILGWLQVPSDVYPLMREYLVIIFAGIIFTFLYNYLASLLRAVGDSVTPLVFLGAAAVSNVVLDILFVVYFHWGVAGAAAATVIAQIISALALAAYSFMKYRYLWPAARNRQITLLSLREVARFSFLTCVQQSVMNFGILMVQGLVNSFGVAVMAAFTVAVKIDSFAYMPVQDFGNAFSTFIAQNFGARKMDRIRQGIKSAFKTALVFSAAVSLLVCVFARELMLIFVQPEETELLAIGVQYLRIEGAFYCGIGCLFLFYGLYRAVKIPEMSVVLTVISLGTRVALAYILSAVPAIGVVGIWWAIPIGWLLADAAGWLYYVKNKERIARLLAQ